MFVFGLLVVNIFALLTIRILNLSFEMCYSYLLDGYHLYVIITLLAGSIIRAIDIVF